ncbi:MAG: four helix bundle protein [Rickettsiales bacterium]|jgi:four helix bundle protein|nr:four helix bundle protein [Rickettsiales bacterium]
MKSVEDLDVFKKSFDLTSEIYRLTESFPKSETFGLVSQMRRAAISIGSNLMEGGARLTDGEMKQFIGIARGSAAELKFQLMISCRLKFISSADGCVLITETDNIRKMLTGLLKSIQSNHKSQVTNHG